MVLTSSWWRFLENYVYDIPEPPSRVRTKPLEVICVGPPRSATESLQAALLRLGYDHTHHGWDILFEKPNYARGWARLARRKWLNEAPGLPIMAADFDKLMGNSVAVTDAAASCFAAEMVAAYPDAKVVLNIRKDLDQWLRSMDESMLKASRSTALWLIPWFDADFWWIRHAFGRLMWPGLFQCMDSREHYADSIMARGKLAYEAHCNMIRGLVPPERLLEWSAQDGWEPLCKFLGKDIPDEPFPHVNTSDKGWKERETQMGIELATPAVKKLGFTLLTGLGVVISISFAVYWRG